MDDGPFQTIFQRAKISRPSSKPKFLGYLSLLFRLKFNLHELMERLMNGVKLVFGNMRSIAKVGIVELPFAVKLCDTPVGISCSISAN